MRLYEYNPAIELFLQEYIDEETGEMLIPEDALNKLHDLQMGKEEKVENICLYVKNMMSEIMAIKMEEENLKKRRTILETKTERLKEYLRTTIPGEEFSSGKYKLSWRSSESTEIPDESILPKKYLKKTVSYKPDKVAIKAALKSGLKVKGASLVSKSNPQIK